MEAMAESPMSFQEGEDGVGGIVAGGGRGGADGMRLVQLLVACAEARPGRGAAAGRRARARHGVPARGLVLRAGPGGPAGAGAPAGAVAREHGVLHPAVVVRGGALALAYELCPYLRFAHFVANASVLEAFEGEGYVHVVDLGNSGHDAGPGARPARWQARPRARHRRRRTNRHHESHRPRAGVLRGGARDAARVQRRGRRRRPRGRGRAREQRPGAALSGEGEPRHAELGAADDPQAVSPRAFVLVEQDAGHNGPFFLGRFMEALHYYAALPRPRRAVPLRRRDPQRRRVRARGPVAPALEPRGLPVRAHQDGRQGAGVAGGERRWPRRRDASSSDGRASLSSPPPAGNARPTHQPPVLFSALCATHALYSISTCTPATTLHIQG
jgi:hypothetical protein